MEKIKIKKIPTEREKSDWIAAYVFISPLVIGIGIFYILPFIKNIWFSFNNVNKFNVTTFNGIENYKRLFDEPMLWKSILNTFKYVFIVVPSGILISLLTASLLNVNIRGKSFYRTIYYLPSVTMPVAIALVWRWIFNGDYGILNNILKVFGIQGRSWLSDPKLALYMVMIVSIWTAIGYNFIVLLAGMQGISKSYYEAASIDGAGYFVKFKKITLPLLSPTIFFLTITGFIGGFQVFDIIYMMISPNSPAFEHSQTINMLFYRTAFIYGYKGYAAAISMIIFIIILIFTIIQMVVQKKWVNYD